MGPLHPTEGVVDPSGRTIIIFASGMRVFGCLRLKRHTKCNTFPVPTLTTWGVREGERGPAFSCFFRCFGWAQVVWDAVSRFLRLFRYRGKTNRN